MAAARELRGLPALEENLGARGLLPVYLLLGEDRQQVEAALELLTDRAVPEELRALGALRLRGPDATVDDVVAACQTLPMLSNRRLVVVREPEKLEGDAERLVAYVAAPCPTTCLVLVPLAFDRRLRVSKGLLAHATTAQFEPPSGSDLDAWVRLALSSRGITVKQDALDLLRDLVQADTLLLSNELEKLALACAGTRVVEKADVGDLLGRTRALEIWDLTNAIEDGNAEAAARTLRLLLQRGAAVPMLVGTLDWCLGRLVGSEPPKTHPGRRRALEARRRAVAGRAEELYALLRAADRMVRTSGASAEAALERFVLAACG